MNYKSVTLREEFSIHQIISIHYFEYMSDFLFSGESHDFWEFLYVDKGEVEVVANQEKLTLRQGQIIFHKPNEFHSLSANGIVAPNLVVMSFDCEDPSMEFFNDKILTIDAAERHLLAQIIVETRDCFHGPINNPYQEQLIYKEHPRFGAGQLIKTYLEQFLIHLFRNFAYAPPQKATAFSSAFTSKSEVNYASILEYLEFHLCDHLTVEQICKDNLISNSQLKKLFREQANCGVIAFFNKMKIQQAKELIRARQMNFSQIADYLGYTSIHYFSRQFKQLTGMTPSEYTDSIKQLAEKPYAK